MLTKIDVVEKNFTFNWNEEIHTGRKK